MNKMLVAVFDTDEAAGAGLQALHKLHGTGYITLYATGVLAKGAEAKAESLEARRAATQGEVKARSQDRVKRMKGAYQTRGAKLSRAWDLTWEALTA